MSHDYDIREMEHATAIAAAAFAVISQEVSEILRQNQTSGAPETSSLTKTKSKVDGTKSPISQLGSVSKRLSGVGSFKSTDGEANKVQISLVTDEKKPEKAHISAPSVKKTPTFSYPLKSTDDKKLETPASKRTPTFGDKSTDSTKLGPPAPKSPPPPIPQIKTTTKPGPPRPPSPQTSARRPTQVRSMETKADAWEKAELEKIKQRYEKLKETIASWEDKKRMKARRKLEKHEGEPDRKRMKAVEKYRSKMQYIDQIAGGARAQADDERRNEELKVKEKANIFRTTGHLPRACPCF